MTPAADKCRLGRSDLEHHRKTRIAPDHPRCWSEEMRFDFPGKKLESIASTAARSSSTSYSSTSRERAREILALLKGVVLQGRTILDIGCGPAPLSDNFRYMSSRIVGLDREHRYVKQARKNFLLELVLGDATNLPFKDESFNFVLCNDVLEHIADSERLANELSRVLAQGSATYVQCASKYQIIEPHFLLPFLSWLPQPFADLYVRLSRRGESYAGYHPKTRKELLHLFRGYRTIDLTYERTLMKIKTLSIKSKSLLCTVSCLRKILPDQVIAALTEKFSILAILVFKD